VPVLRLNYSIILHSQSRDSDRPTGHYLSVTAGLATKQAEPDSWALARLLVPIPPACGK
jgi:hypothetical protein